MGRLSRPMAIIYAPAVCCPGKHHGMKRSKLSLLALLAAGLPAQEAATPADYQFRSGGLQFDGVQNLAQLRGKPVLIEFWGIN